jgi:preprotein translocase subunit SecE
MQTAILAFFGLIVVFLVAAGIKYRMTIRQFTGDVRAEMDKVTWPSQAEIVNSTVLVFVVTIILTIMVWIVDFVLGHVMSGLMKLFV